jgi:hypothetical protein
VDSAKPSSSSSSIAESPDWSPPQPEYFQLINLKSGQALAVRANSGGLLESSECDLDEERQQFLFQPVPDGM